MSWISIVAVIILSILLIGIIGSTGLYYAFKYEVPPPRVIGVSDFTIL